MSQGNLLLDGDEGGLLLACLTLSRTPEGLGSLPTPSLSIPDPQGLAPIPGVEPRYSGEFRGAGARRGDGRRCRGMCL